MPLPLPLVILLVALVTFGVGWALQTTMLNRMIGPNPVPAMVATIGLSIIIRNALVATFGADVRAIDIGSLQDKGVSIFGVSVGVLPILIFLTAVALFLVMHMLLTRTTLGRAFRAAADDFEILETLGFNRRQVYATAMGIAVTLSAVAGLLLAIRSSYSPYSGVERLLISFEVVIIGGIGSLRGSFFAGLFLGVVQLIGLKINPNSGPLFGHLAFFLILLAKQANLPALIRWRRT
jgi:branched-chain amino acid transport system permease protein